MVTDIIVSYSYWIVFLTFFLGAVCFLKASFLDFNFIISIFLSQYVAHSTVFIGTAHFDIFIFSAMFYALYVMSFKVEFGGRSDFNQYIANAIELLASKNLILFSKWFVIFLFFVKFKNGFHGVAELDLADRLEAQNSDRFLFLLTLVLFPAICMNIYDWIVNGFRGKWFNMVVAIAILLILIGSASKSALVPLLIGYLGVVSYLKKEVSKQMKYILVFVFAALILASFVMLSYMFPQLSFRDILDLILNRVAANTDSLEYIFVNGNSPGDYPFAGVFALFPFAAKLLGVSYDYPPGVWLHGIRYGVWDGYGPNSGIIMDYFANLSWCGLIVAPLLAMFMKSCLKLNNLLGCAFASMGYVAFIDIQMFEIEVIFWSAIVIFLCGVGLLRCLWSTPEL